MSQCFSPNHHLPVVHAASYPTTVPPNPRQPVPLLSPQNTGFRSSLMLTPILLSCPYVLTPVLTSIGTVRSSPPPKRGSWWEKEFASPFLSYFFTRSDDVWPFVMRTHFHVSPYLPSDFHLCSSFLAVLLPAVRSRQCRSVLTWAL